VELEKTMFDSAYEVILADTTAARTIHQKIRYHVYCVECQFEPPSAFASGEEHDPWDVHAVPFIVRSRLSGAWVATMRVILPQAATFPIETLQCLAEPPAGNDFHRWRLAEVSRICIIHSPNPRRINPHLDWNFEHVSGKNEPEVLLGLIRAGIFYGLAQGMKGSYLLVTSPFARLLKRLGLVMEPVGVAVEHHGRRTPYLMDLVESAAKVSRRSTAVRDLFARKTLAYRPFSALSAAEQVSLPLLPSSVPLPAAEAVLRADGVRRSSF
jgi:N-acyl amino acid synthase of PEP-CTERM/exosortase system